MWPLSHRWKSPRAWWFPCRFSRAPIRDVCEAKCSLAVSWSWERLPRESCRMVICTWVLTFVSRPPNFGSVLHYTCGNVLRCTFVRATVLSHPSLTVIAFNYEHTTYTVPCRRIKRATEKHVIHTFTFKRGLFLFMFLTFFVIKYSSNCTAFHSGVFSTLDYVVGGFIMRLLYYQ